MFILDMHNMSIIVINNICYQQYLLCFLSIIIIIITIIIIVLCICETCR